MKISKSILQLLLVFLITCSFLGCSSAKKLQKHTPFTVGKVYYKAWVSGVKGGGSGTNLFIPIANPKNIVLDSVYFMGKQVKLEHKNDSLFIGRFKKETNSSQDIIMSNTPYAEYGNKVPKIHKKNPFSLKDNECIISYTIKSKIMYFKVDNVIKKKSSQYR